MFHGSGCRFRSRRLISSREMGGHPRSTASGNISRFSQLLADSQNELARIITLEQGKALQESTGEVPRASSEASFSAEKRCAYAEKPSRANGPALPVTPFLNL